MIILGIDPGLASVGYGVIETNGSNQKCVDYGVIYTPKEESLPQRLAMIERGMNALIDKFQPDEIALEELFFVKNITNGIAVAHARGVVVLTAIKKLGTLYEYTPLQVKQAITGYGRADKKQMQQMVKVLLKLKDIPKPDDAADGLAIAITHHQCRRFAKNFQI
ncbi:MAG: crossover junction endodeoxyribonuclease RuvC [Bacillota bacterium]